MRLTAQNTTTTAFGFDACADEIKYMQGLIDSVKSVDTFIRKVSQRFQETEDDACKQFVYLHGVSNIGLSYQRPYAAIALLDSLRPFVPKKNVKGEIDAVIMLLRASNLSSAGELELAKVYIDSLIRLFQGGGFDKITESQFHFTLAAVAGENGYLPEAIKILEHAEELFPEDSVVIYRSNFLRISISLGLNNDRSAAEYYRKAETYVDTSQFLRDAVAEFYTLGAFLYNRLDSFSRSYDLAVLSENFRAPNTSFLMGYNLHCMCADRGEIGVEDPKAPCTRLLQFARGKNEIPYIRNLGYATLMKQGMKFDWELLTIRDIYKEWETLRENSEVTGNAERLAILKAKHRLALANILGQPDLTTFDSIVSIHDYQLEAKTQKIVDELNIKHQTQIRQDSIINLSLRSEAAEAVAATRNIQLLLLASVLATLAGAFIFVRRASRRRKHLNEQLQEKNVQISRLNSEITHRASNHLHNVKLLLVNQRKRAIAAGLDVSIANALERQILAYTKLQEQLSTNHVKVNLKEYLEKFSEGLQEAFAAGGQRIIFDLNIAKLAVKPDFAAPLALIINELATNSLKYARREDGILKIALDVTLEKGGDLRVYYRDGGPQDGEVDPMVHSSGEGMELVKGFTWELAGEIIRYGSGDGFDFEAVFEMAA
jgi:two-component sensor histidine kinase